jgi:hypothetical protein
LLNCKIEVYKKLKINNIIKIIFINCNWVVNRWQWLLYMYTKYEIAIKEH